MNIYLISKVNLKESRIDVRQKIAGGQKESNLTTIVRQKIVGCLTKVDLMKVHGQNNCMGRQMPEGGAKNKGDWRLSPKSSKVTPITFSVSLQNWNREQNLCNCQLVVECWVYNCLEYFKTSGISFILRFCQLRMIECKRVTFEIKYLRVHRCSMYGLPPHLEIGTCFEPLEVVWHVPSVMKSVPFCGFWICYLWTEVNFLMPGYRFWSQIHH